MKQRKYSRNELLRFLAAVDECLEEPAKMVLVGGSAIIIAHGVTTTTVDIDTISNTTAVLERAIGLAHAQTGLRLPVSRAGTAQAPEGYEERLVRQPTGGRRLHLYTLEKHDLALSKALRGDERDRQHLVALHRADALDFELLVTRFRDEMLPFYVGSKAPVTDYFLWVIEELFGELSLARATKMLRDD